MANDLKLYTYRYMWKLKGSDKIALRVLSDTMSIHEEFMQKLIDSDDVISACREYVNEYDLQFIGILNTFKEEVK